MRLRAHPDPPVATTGWRHLRETASVASRDTQLVDLQLIIETPENVVLAYPLAGPAIRVLAYLIDFLLRVVIFAVLLLSSWLLFGFVSMSLSTGISLLALFLINWAYYVVCEGCFRGRTP